MDQITIIRKLRNALLHPCIIELETDWPGGRKESIRMEPWLIGRNLDFKWTFICGRDIEKDMLSSIPATYIISVETTDEKFSVSPGRNYYFLVDNENIIVKYAIRDIQITDLRDPNLDREKERADKCFDFDAENVSEEEFGDNDDAEDSHDDEDEDSCEGDDEDSYEEDDEDSRQTCIYCHSGNECEHIVFLYDRSYGEFHGGFETEIDKIAEIIKTQYAEWLREGRKIDCTRNTFHERFNDLWEEACGSYNNSTGIFEFNYDAFMDFMRFAIEDILLQAPNRCCECTIAGHYANDIKSLKKV